MKKVLITGGAGFIGANLIRRLVNFSEYDIFVIEKKNADLRRIKDFLTKIKIKYVDLEDFKKLSKTIDIINPDFVFHLASYGVYPTFQKDMKQMVDTNITGTLNLINSLKNRKISVFVNASTCFVYKDKKSKFKEGDPVDPLNDYAATKLAGELLVKKSASDDNFPAINLRIFTPYGYHEGPQRLMPTIIVNAILGKNIKLFSPDSVRDFIFIEDLIDLFLKIIKNKDISKYKGETFNAGSGKQYRVSEIVSIVEKLFGKKLNVFYEGGGEYKEPKNFSADTKKTKKILKWETSHDIRSGIGKTIKWFKENIKLYEN